MNDSFDNLAKNLARSVARRGALKQFGVWLGGLLLAFGICSRAKAEKSSHGSERDRGYCLVNANGTLTGDCLTFDCHIQQFNPDCTYGRVASNVTYDSTLCFGPFDKAAPCRMRRR